MTIGTIHGGQRHNIIPAEVSLTGRSEPSSPEMSALAEQRLRTILKGVTDANGATGEVVRYERGAPATINDLALTREIVPALERAVGKDHVKRLPPAMGSEDFSFFANEVPGFFFVSARSSQERRRAIITRRRSWPTTARFRSASRP